MEQEQRLDDDREHNISQEFRDRRDHRRSTLPELVSSVSYVLKPECVDDLGQHKQWNDPDEGEDPRESRLDEVPHLALTHEVCCDGSEHGDQDLLEEQDAQKKNSAIQSTALQNTNTHIGFFAKIKPH